MDFSGGRLVTAAFHKRRNWTARTLDGHRDVDVVAVEDGATEQESAVDGVASEGDDGVAAHGAVAFVVHEYRRHVGACTHTRAQRATRDARQKKSRNFP